MKYGFIIPGIELHAMVDMAQEGEEAGWDGIFYWDGVYIAGMAPMYDPWVVMAAMAMRTKHVKIGAVLTPPSRRRPWKLARETVTLDHLSHGRLVLPVGLGAVDDGGISKVGEPVDRKIRAQKLDESLEILTGLWSAKPFSYHGEHYQMEEMTFLPPPVQQPRIPIWVVGAWPSKKSMQRALRYDGLMPTKIMADGSFPVVTVDDLREMKAYVDEHREATTPYDIVWEGETPGDNLAEAQKIVKPFAEVGATWWMESRWSVSSADEIRKRIKQGPPRVEL